MSLTSVGFLIEEAGRNVRRNGLMSLAALSTVAIALSMFGGAALFLFRIHEIVDSLPREFLISVFVDPSTSREKTLDLQKRITAVPGVSSVTLVTKEQAMAELRADDAAHGTSLASELADDNPYPDRLDVRPATPSASARIATTLRKPGAYPDIRAVLDERQTVSSLIGLSRLVRNVGLLIVALLFAATALVIQNTIRLTVIARRRAIRTMQLVGATAGFIRLPLVLEGMFYGAAGGCIAAGAVLLVANQIGAYTSRFQTPIGSVQTTPVSPWTVLVLIAACGALVGWLGSILSMRRYLRHV